MVKKKKKDALASCEVIPGEKLKKKRFGRKISRTEEIERGSII